MVDHDRGECEEWIARSRGNDDDTVRRGWTRLEAKEFVAGAALTDEGRAFRIQLEQRTNELTAPAWQAVGETTTLAYCDAIDAHHDSFLARIDETAGPRWMPALHQR